tara:strand:+ start:3387 stop:4004 length:618 start_codon:yes stop_codon:yes gene_type:complete
MAKISSYSTTTPVLTDKLIGTDVGGTPADATKNFLLSDVQTLFKSGIALSDVLAAGNTATANIVLTGDITATNLAATLAITAPTITASGTVTGATVTATGAVNGATVDASGTVTGATVTSTGVVNCATVDASGTITGATVTSTGDVNAVHVFSTTLRTSVIQKAVGTDLHIGGLDTYADQAAAIAGGLVVDCIYMTATGELRIVL